MDATLAQLLTKLYELQRLCDDQAALIASLRRKIIALEEAIAVAKAGGG